MRRGLLALVLWGCPQTDDDVEPVDTETDAGETDTEDTPPLPDDLPCAVHRHPEPLASTITGDPFRTEELSSQGGMACFAAEDVDGDGFTDIVAGMQAWSPEEDDGLRIYWGGAEGFTEATYPGNQDDGAFEGRNCLLIDKDGDGALELVYATERGLGMVQGLEARAPTYEGLGAYGDGDRFEVMSAALVDLDRTPPLDLILGVAGRQNLCVLPEAGEDGDVILPDLQEQPGRVECFLGTDEGYERVTDARCPAALQGHSSSFPFMIAPFDLNDDVVPDILVTGDFHENVLVTSNETGFDDLSGPSGFGTYNHAMGVAWSDLDGDGLRDAYVTDYGPDEYFKAVGCDLFVRAGSAFSWGDNTGSTISWGVVAADFDHDGDDDVFVTQDIETGPDLYALSTCDFQATGNPSPPNFLLVNDGSARFTRYDLPAPAYPVMSIPRFAVYGDFDNDGDIDVATRQPLNGTFVHWNEAPKAGTWLKVRAVDANGLPVPGVRVEVHHDETHSRMRELHISGATTGQSEAVAHFGLGGEAGPVTVKVRWPDGTETSVETPVDQTLTVERP